MPPRTPIFDVIVAGSGSAGLTAAVVAARSGLRVLLCEKAARFGGTSAWSGGGCWIPGNALATEIGIDDSMDAAADYARTVVGDSLRVDLFAAFCANANPMVDFLLRETEVRFIARNPAPDWRMDAPGAMAGGRALASPVYDGRILGRAMLRRLERPLNSFNAPMGMMMSPLDFMHAMRMFSTPGELRYMAALVWRYALDRVRYGRGSRLAMGNALIARLLKSAVDAGVTLWTDAPVEGLIAEGARVVGVTVRRGSASVPLHAARGVVLATGGFAADPALRAARLGADSDLPSMVAAGNRGDGVRMAETQGARLQDGNRMAASWGVVSTLPGRGDARGRCLHFFMDLPKPGFIVVGPDGRRFANEADFQIGPKMVATGLKEAWLIGDHRAVRRYGMGLVWPFAFNLRLLQWRGYVRSASSLAGLARKIGIDPAVLETAVRHFNESARAGEDGDWGRGASFLDRSLGDPAHRPNPSLGPLETAPFHAVRLTPGDAGSVDGLRVDPSARVLGADDEPIPGLYACGLDMNSLWAGAPLGTGMNHAHNMTFAYIAARHLADAQGVPQEMAA